MVFISRNDASIELYCLSSDCPEPRTTELSASLRWTTCDRLLLPKRHTSLQSTESDLAIAKASLCKMRRQLVAASSSWSWCAKHKVLYASLRNRSSLSVEKFAMIVFALLSFSLPTLMRHCSPALVSPAHLYKTRHLKTSSTLHGGEDVDEAEPVISDMNIEPRLMCYEAWLFTCGPSL